MRVALLTDAFKLGGGLEHIYQIASGMRDIEFCIFGEGGTSHNKCEALQNVLVYREGYSPGDVLPFRPDLIHIHHIKPLLAFCGNPFADHNIPIIFTVHGLHIHKYEFTGGMLRWIKYFTRFALERYLFSRASGLITVSQEDSDFINSKYHMKTTCIPNGIDQSRFVSTHEPVIKIRQRLKLPVDHFLCLTVARFDFQKGYDLLIRAVYHIKDIARENHVKFVLVGHGDTFQETVRSVSSMSVSDLFIFLGERTDVYELMQACNLFILPSRWEGLPIVLIEAGLCKMLIVASDTYGNREIIHDYKGLLFRNADSEDLSRVLLAAITKTNMADSVSDQAYDVFREKYDVCTMLKALRHYYESRSEAYHGIREQI